MPANYDVIDFFIYDQFGTIRKVDSGRMACKLIFSLIVTFLLQKLKAELKYL